MCARRVLNVVLEAGARLARPGEFTLRAFLNGRLDLTQVGSISPVNSIRGVAGVLRGVLEAARSHSVDLMPRTGSFCV